MRLSIVVVSKHVVFVCGVAEIIYRRPTSAFCDKKMGKANFATSWSFAIRL
jgi:hypothetical protein